MVDMEEDSTAMVDLEGDSSVVEEDLEAVEEDLEAVEEVLEVVEEVLVADMVVVEVMVA